MMFIVFCDDVYIVYDNYKKKIGFLILKIVLRNSDFALCSDIWVLFS